jgi:crossover junction endodeoxyribonuclease RuvC
MKILSIDPGYGRCGIAVLSGNAVKQNCEYSNCIETSSDDDFTDRLHKICQDVKSVIEKHNPDALAIEKLFFNRNTTTAMKVAQVKGAIILTAKVAGMSIHEYAPQEIKTAVTGYGKSSKQQMVIMTKQLVSVRDDAKYDDEYDAVAVGITCLAHVG